ncbi:MAG: MerR family transcriptional regulator [Burkholderiales bacterium]|nr:MerR family transcriptional regulator [Burkholderiales bacterium]
MLIGELATTSGLSRETLRFYEKLGLIHSRRLPNGYRRYSPETLTLVMYIRTAQQLGFSLSEIGREIPRLWQGAVSDADIAQVLQNKLADIDQRIEALQSLREDLAARLASACPLRTPSTTSPHPATVADGSTRGAARRA